MSLQRRLVAVMALLLVAGLLVADVVTYASVRSYLYGQADNTLAQNEALGFNYLRYSAARNVPVTPSDLSRRVSSDVYLILLNRQGYVILRRQSGPAAHPDPTPIVTKNIPAQVRHLDLHALVAQGHGQQVGDAGLVVDDEDAGGLGHRSAPACALIL